ncbi:MAG: 50S ribosomal protein L9 [Clostridia bacterium]
MKVLLLADVKGQGKKGQIIDVSDGYAKNFLFLKKLASIATTDTLNSVKLHEAAETKKQAEEKAVQGELAKKLKGQEVTVTIKCGDKGRIFGSVTGKEIADALNSMGYNVDKKQLVLKENIKNIGKYPVSIKLYANISTGFIVNVIPLQE